MFQFPYGNLHGLNLDWVLAEWKKFKDAFTTAFTTSVTNLPVSSQPTVDVTYDQDENKFNFDFGIPAEVKPQSFQIGYAESSSGTVIPTGVTWLANPPAVAQGNYLWSRTMVVYNDGSFSATYACSRMGVDGSSTPATVTPLMDGVGAVGTSDKFAREDHVHPSDTSKINVSAISSANPSMDGVASAGSSTNVSRADHVHPSDTSKLSLIDVGYIAGPVVANDTIDMSTYLSTAKIMVITIGRYGDAASFTLTTDSWANGMYDGGITAFAKNTSHYVTIKRSGTNLIIVGFTLDGDPHVRLSYAT